MFNKFIQQKPFWLCVENIRSAYNVGAMFRTADATGLWGLILIGITPKPDHVRVFKTALGAEKSVPYLSFDNTQEFLDFLQKNRRSKNLWSLELVEGADNLFLLDRTDVPEPLFLTVGNEIDGVSARILTNSNKHVFIPMNGIKVSLNVAEASSIAMFEFFRKRKYQ